MKKISLILSIILVSLAGSIFSQSKNKPVEKTYKGTIKVIGCFSSDGGGALGVDFKFIPTTKNDFLPGIPAKKLAKLFVYIEESDYVHRGSAFTCSIKRAKDDPESWEITIFLNSKKGYTRTGAFHI